VPADAAPGELTVRGEVAYMACTEEMCDPPGATEFVATLVVEEGPARPEHAPGAKPGEEPERGVAPTPATPPAEGGGDSGGDSAGSAPGSGATSGIAGADSQLEAMPLGLFLLAAIGWGLFALAMPCTYPMIPITISFFTKQASSRGGHVAPMALLYGLGIVGMFVLIGVAVGNPIVLFAAHPITNLVIAALFFVFALVLFGVIHLQPPQFLMRAVSKASSQGGYVGVFLMGATLVVTSFTCTAPFVGSLLAIGGEGGDLGRVVLGMAVFGLTMAVPFVLLSLLPGKLQALPRSGEWMNTLKVFLGFVEIAAALKFLSNVDMVWQWRWLSRELFLSLWAGTFVLAGVFLAGMIRLKGETGEIGPGRLVGSLASLLLAAYCAYGALGNRMDWVMDAIAPPYHNRVVGLAGSADGSGEPSASHDYIEDDYDAARRLAQETGRKLLLNFTGVT
jgi:thiol:disulfide interchange protein DsbD